MVGDHACKAIAPSEIRAEQAAQNDTSRRSATLVASQSPKVLSQAARRRNWRNELTMTDLEVSPKTVSIITPCYNEQDNVRNLYNQVREVMLGIGKYRYEHIFIDNSSKDATVAILRQIAAEDR